MKDIYSVPLKLLNYSTFILVILLSPCQANALRLSNIDNSVVKDTWPLTKEMTPMDYPLCLWIISPSSEINLLLPEVNSLSQDTVNTDFKVPEGFSPNGDGINDILNISWIKEYDRVSITIFNRWGNIVFKTNKFSGQWDGMSNTGITIGKKLPAATYYYVITIEDLHKKINGYLFLAW